jgi:putative holliday junction resolvase
VGAARLPRGRERPGSEVAGHPYPGRVLGIDAGERRVGLALSDETRLVATPLMVLDRRASLAVVLDTIAALAARERVTQVVVGLPLNADGSAGPQAKRAERFSRLVERATELPVTLWDERLSTQAAEGVLRAQGRNTRRARSTGQIDAVAAAVILQDYLDASEQPA